MKEYRKLIKEGFVFTDQVFALKDIEKSKNAFWSVINCDYDTGIEPETRFWNPGDNPKDIIKIDKPHLSSKVIFELITNTGIKLNTVLSSTAKLLFVFSLLCSIGLVI